MANLDWDTFLKVDMRVGTIVSAKRSDKAIKAAYILEIDFGPLGIKRSSAQITDKYEVGDLPGKQIIAVINFPPKQIANVISECLVLGAVDTNGHVTLIQAEHAAHNGDRIA